MAVRQAQVTQQGTGQIETHPESATNRPIDVQAQILPVFVPLGIQERMLPRAKT